MLAEGLARSRSEAQGLIRSGRVLVDDVPVEKPGTAVADTATLRVRGDTRRYVSRGGEKLEGALADLEIDVTGMVCLDVGASTGGFTDCLLAHGATQVVALDVGYGQLATTLRDDPRVQVLERSNARNLSGEALPPGIQLVTVDVSFISSRLILERLAQVVPQAAVLVMVKPQFEVGREQVGKGGVVRDPALRAQAVASVQACGKQLGYRCVATAESRLPGPKGNREVFVWLEPEPSGRIDD